MASSEFMTSPKFMVLNSLSFYKTIIVTPEITTFEWNGLLSYFLQGR
jgi:hypothetical protein